MTSSTATTPSDNPIHRSRSLFVSREDAQNAPSSHVKAFFGDSTLGPLHLFLYQAAIRLQKLAHGKHVILDGGSSESIAGSGNIPIKDEFRCLKAIIIHKAGATRLSDLTEHRHEIEEAEMVFLNGRCIKNRHGFMDWAVDDDSWTND